MNAYEMTISHFAGSKDHFAVRADSAEEALKKAKVLVYRQPQWSFGGNYNMNDVQLVKKIPPKKAGKCGLKFIDLEER